MSRIEIRWAEQMGVFLSPVDPNRGIRIIGGGLNGGRSLLPAEHPPVGYLLFGDGESLAWAVYTEPYHFRNSTALAVFADWIEEHMPNLTGWPEVLRKGAGVL